MTRFSMKVRRMFENINSFNLYKLSVTTMFLRAHFSATRYPTWAIAHPTFSVLPRARTGWAIAQVGWAIAQVGWAIAQVLGGS